ncbi:MAG: hypothetical protein RBS77_01830 [Candidatus Moranbacteria bacterium]|jgi:hypothetical protein|nr:hypothetical protein [Candidatus Moranbacteria bacterium]
MEDKFSSYDVIAHIIPGGFLWIGLSLYPYLILNQLIKEQGDNARLAIYLMLFFSIGLIIQYLSSIVEFIIKKKEWGGKMFSEVCLIKPFCNIENNTRDQILKEIANRFNYPIESLVETLHVTNTKSQEFNQATRLCKEIYYKINAYTLEKGSFNKAHSYYEMYGLFRGLCFNCIFLAIVFSFLLFFHNGYEVLINWLYIITFVILSFTFYDRAIDRGERYVDGLLYSFLVINNQESQAK